ncbi:MAG: YHS domain-containing (seleno)protein [Acidobacteriota bacterium]
MPIVRRTCTLATVLFFLAASAFAVSPVNSNWRGVAIHGYDPVAYFTDQKAVEGSSDVTFEWQGATWRFATAEHRKLFAAEPGKYAPQYGGYCAFAVAKNSTADIEPEAFTLIDGKLYLNYDAKIQETWRKDTKGYIQKADAFWPQMIRK